MRLLELGNLGLCDLGTFGDVYFLTLGLLGTSRPFDFWTSGLYDFSTSGFLDCLICRFLDFVDFPTFGLLDFGTFRLWDLGLWDFFTFRLFDDASTLFVFLQFVFPDASVMC